MIGRLPTKLNVNGVDRAIRSDFRVVLLIFQAFNDPELSVYEKSIITIECLYEDASFYVEEIEEIEEAYRKAVWFLDGGGDERPTHGHQTQPKRVMDWKQDEQIIFSAVNKVAGFETRAKDYIHWWTFLGYFNEIGEGLFTTVISIRNKINRNKKLDKVEKEFYKENKSLIDLDKKYSKEQQAEIDRINEMLNS